MTLPYVPECRLEVLPDKQLRVMHKESGQSRIVSTPRAAELAGLMLRCLATYQQAETA